MPRKPLSLRIDADLYDRVDGARGDVPRTRWVERALESALGPDTKDASVSGAGRPAASSRTSERSVAENVVVAPDGSLRAATSKDLAGLGKIPGVKTARELAMERQAKLNKGKS